MVHSGIGTQYDCQFVLARKSRNHKTAAKVVDGIVVFPAILARELVSSSTGLWHRPSLLTQGSGRRQIRYFCLYICVSDIRIPYLAVQDG